jgi:hypothetical protein
MKVTKVGHIFCHFTQQSSLCFNLDEKWVGLQSGRNFHKLIWSPWLLGTQMLNHHGSLKMSQATDRGLGRMDR